MKNEVQLGRNVDFPVSIIVTANTIAAAGNFPLGGEPTVIGDLAGVLATSPGKPAFDYVGNPYYAPGEVLADKVDVQLGGVFLLSVISKNGGTNAATAIGARVYFDVATGLLSLDATKIHFGWALDPVASGVTNVIRVKLRG